MELTLIIFCSYSMGSIPFGYILTKIFLKKDIRDIGSGNIGATNALRTGNKVIGYSKKLKPSRRNEIEIVDLLNKYKKNNKLTAQFLGRGGAWLDTGSIKDFYDTSAFVSALENRQGLKIACLEEIAQNNKWIGKKEIINSIKFYGKCEYSNYLNKLIK